MIYKGSHKLGDFFTSRRERGMPGLPMLSVTMNNGVVTRESLGRKMETNLSDEEHLLVRKDDIVYNMMRMWQGASGLADRDGLISPAYVVLAPKKGIDPLYASHLFKSSRLIYLLWAYSYGLTSDRLRLYFNDFKSIPVNIPSLPEQRKIGKIISTWDKAIEIAEKLIGNSKAQKTALMQQLLNGVKRLPGFDEKWKKVRLGDIAEINSGGTPKTAIEEYFGGEIPWVSIADMTGRGKYINKSERNITSLGLKNSAACLFPKNTILYAMYASIGECSIATVEVSSSQAILGIRPNSLIDVEYLYLYLSSLKERIKLQGQQGTQANLNAGMVKDFHLDLPPTDEQQKIAQVLTAADREIETLQQKLACLKQEKKALMQQLLTGKRRVKVDQS